MRKVKPQKFSQEQINALMEGLQNQKMTTSTEKSADPVNFPVFEVPVNSKVLIYVPNYEMTVNTPDGPKTELRMDRPWIHNVTEGGNRYSKIRCLRGLAGIGGYPEDMECPFCAASRDSWELANLIIDDTCKAKGLNRNDSDNSEVKTIKISAYNGKVVGDPTQYYTFPIVVIETEPDDIKKIVTDEQGNMKYKIMWYNIAKSTYDSKWAKTLEDMEDEPDTPAGHFFVLNYTYDVKAGAEPNRRDSAKALRVAPKTMGGAAAEVAAEFDKRAEEWTPAKAIETVYDNMLPDYEFAVEEADRVITPTRTKIAFYKNETEVAAGNAVAAGNPFKLTAGANVDSDEVNDVGIGLVTDED